MQKNSLIDEKLLETIILHRKKGIKKNRGTDAVVYTRVSSQEQQSNGSLETQKKQCEQFAKSHGRKICKFFGDVYESAKTDERKEFKKMLTYVKRNMNVSWIIVHNYDRFSRTGSSAAKVSEDLGKEGVMIKAVMQDLDSSLPHGRMQENIVHTFNNFDNQLKSQRTKINTREVMEKGFWPYAAPKGYLNLKPKHQACYHEYVITEQGSIIRQGFKMILNSKLSNVEIIDRLKAKGVTITASNFRQVFTNPFYAGYVTGSLIQGRLIKGKHPALIDLKTFLKVQARLNETPIAGIPKESKHDEVPLKVFAKDDLTGLPFTGYQTKGIWYYKLKKADVPVNVNAKIMNDDFVILLSRFEVKNAKMPLLKKLLLQKVKQQLAQNISDTQVLKKRLTERENFLQKIEEKFISEQINQEVYNRQITIVNRDITEIRETLKSAVTNGSNLEIVVAKCLEISQSLSQAWIEHDYENKQRLQQLLFPEGIFYNKQKRVVRTPKINSVFGLIPQLDEPSGDKKISDSSLNRLKFPSVPPTVQFSNHFIPDLTRLANLMTA